MRRLIDLPGFGFAKVSKSKRAHWGKVIPRYLETRRSLIGLVLVIDSRHPFKQEEKELLHWCAEADLPVLALLNKSDKLKQKEKHTAKKNAQQIMHEMPIFVEALLYSAETGERTDQIFDVITPWFKDTAPAGELSDGEV